VADEQMFIEKVQDIDQRLSAIYIQAFNDCHTPESAFKLIMTLGQLLDRPIIKADIEPLFPKYLTMLDEDLDLIKVF